MRYCPDCGDPHECAAESRTDPGRTEVELAKINRQADVEIARIQAAETKTYADADVKIAESEILVEAAAAEGAAEGMLQVIDAVTGPAEPENPETVVVESPAPETEPEPELAPPPVEHHETGNSKSGWHW